jgi:flagellar protein FlbD
MIHLTRLNQLPVVVNSDLIEHIEMNPDTVLALANGQKILVRETADEIIERIIRFRQAVLSGRPAQCAVASSRIAETPNMLGGVEGPNGAK